MQETHKTTSFNNSPKKHSNVECSSEHLTKECFSKHKYVYNFMSTKLQNYVRVL